MTQGSAVRTRNRFGHERPSLRDLAASTPATRDRYVDLLRAVSIAVVVSGHWLIAVIVWRGGEIGGFNLLDERPALWVATWLAQVMPVFFFVGGFSNLVSLDSTVRRGGGGADFIRSRMHRLLAPTGVFLAVWTVVYVFLEETGLVPAAALSKAGRLLTAPLWFLGVYMIVVGFAPWTIRLHRRFGTRALAAMVGGAIVVDVADLLLGVPLVGYLNFALVWLAIHQVGYFYADGRLTATRGARHAVTAGAGLILLLLLTGPGPYSEAMIGVGGGRSNVNPPTVALLALTAWQVGLVMLLRGPASRWLSRVRVWAGVIGANSVIMTIFLWHQTAMVIGAVILFPLGFPQPAGGTQFWWALRPLWLGALAVILAALVGLFAWAERLRSRPTASTASPGLGTVLWTTGVVHLIAGLLGVAVGGFDGFAASSGDRLVVLEANPLHNILHLALGWLLLEAGTGHSRRGTLLAIGGAFSAMAALGVATTGGTANLLAANSASDVLNALSGIVVVGAALARPAPGAEVRGSVPRHGNRSAATLQHERRKRAEGRRHPPWS